MVDGAHQPNAKSPNSRRRLLTGENLGMPDFYILNIVFQLKMFTILLAGTTLLVFYCTSAFRSLEHIGPGEDAPPFAKFIAAGSIVLWIAVIVLGRYIPFGEVT